MGFRDFIIARFEELNMTTKVTVDAHAGWPVEVVTIVGEPGYPKSAQLTVVDSNTEQDFYIHSGLSILSVSEMQRDD